MFVFTLRVKSYIQHASFRNFECVGILELV